MNEQLLLFDVDSRQLALRVACVREILRCVALSPPLNADQRLEGFLNLRGRIIPVLDLRGAMGLKAKSLSAADTLIVVEHAQHVWVLRADGIPAIYDADRNAIEPAAYHKLTPESVLVRQHVAFILDPGRLQQWLDEGEGIAE